MEFGDGAPRRGFRRFFDDIFRTRQEGHPRAQRQDDGRPGIATAPGLGLVRGAHELEERPGRAAVLAVGLRDEDGSHQPDDRQGQGNRDPDPEDPGIEGLDLT